MRKYPYRIQGGLMNQFFYQNQICNNRRAHCHPIAAGSMPARIYYPPQQAAMPHWSQVPSYTPPRQTIHPDQMQAAPHGSPVTQQARPAPTTAMGQIGIGATVVLGDEIDTREDCKNQLPELAQRLGYKEEHIRSWGRITWDSNKPSQPISIKQDNAGNYYFNILETKNGELKWRPVTAKEDPELFAALKTKYPESKSASTSSASAPKVKPKYPSDADFHPEIFENTEAGWAKVEESGLAIIKKPGGLSSKELRKHSEETKMPVFNFSSIAKLKADVMFYKDSNDKPVPIIVIPRKNGQKDFCTYRNGDLAKVTDPALKKCLEYKYNQLMMGNTDD